MVRAQLERWQDHPNTGRDARVDGVAGCLSRKKLTAETAAKKKAKKRKRIRNSRRAALGNAGMARHGTLSRRLAKEQPPDRQY
jgi:hypothetical protein